MAPDTLRQYKAKRNFLRTSEPAELPRRWQGAPFAREVDQTRAQLAPIRSRQGLIASFSREASVAVSRDKCSGPWEHAGPRGEPAVAARFCHWIPQ